jgi:hypothetical protein
MNAAMGALLLGGGATLTMDVCGFVLARTAGTSFPDYRLVGRWIGHMPGGRFHHDSIAAAEPVRTEKLLGWITHYATGIAFAGGFVALAGLDWLRQPTLVPALLFGLVSVAAPFLLMQPCMGLGVAASRTPRPLSSRARSILNHVLFGFGLYSAGSILSWLSF